METEEQINQKGLAINSALSNDWKKAIEINLVILAQNPQDTETLNRLSHAYQEIGMIGKAKSTYKKVLQLDPYNSIATNNLEKLSSLTKRDLTRSQREATNLNLMSSDLFLEEPGKTKVVDLGDLAMGNILATLHIGDEVVLEAHGQEVVVVLGTKRLGKLPPEIGVKTADAIRKGSKFSVVIKSVVIKKSRQETLVSIFIREVFHSPKLITPPFLSSTNSNSTAFIRAESLPLMDTRGGLVLESDDELDSSPSFQPMREEENEDNQPPTANPDDEEDFTSR